MTQQTLEASTPCYLLKHGSQPISVPIHPDDPNANCVCVYGFSDKPVYDQFVKTATRLLTPYPLVKGYLANQLATDSISADTISETETVLRRLVVLDATDESQTVVLAASMASVLAAQQQGAKRVSVEYELTFDPSTKSYRFSNTVAAAAN
ncbi:hypothetical protein [Mariniblastus fucicola]|uniref:Uncharacterized protein n=1 Tax=Mariniblastus fucicola TaxID=980251 RepID=A0A5B9P3D9_9BACT|nr:hypothetical protein [Mariniblastus fucicola]QEG21077.1 hypothetical protein MFFC18_09290 [Mariniblastus fucicola]